MFVLLVHYIAPQEKVDDYMGQHTQYLAKHYKLGHFIASGRKVPKTGGVIVMGNIEKDLAEEIIQEDPFHIHQIARFELIEFQSIMVCKELKTWME